MLQNIIPFAISILIGALIGVERERKKQIDKEKSELGIRTSILVSLFGTIATYLAVNLNAYIFLISFSALTILTIISHYYLTINHKAIGLTNEITLLLIFVYGSLCAINHIQLAIALGIITTLILSTKDTLHEFAKTLQTKELYNALLFGIIAFIILPLLPNQNFDTQIVGYFIPQDLLPETFNAVEVLNPFLIWMLVVVISGISFIGYILIKLFGQRLGLSLSGMLGGLYSSTATSLYLSQRSKELSHAKKPILAGIFLASSISFIKTFIFVKALNEELFLRILPTLFLMFIYLLGVGLFLYFGKETKKIQKTKTNFKSPFNLLNALKIAGFIVMALIFAKVALTLGGPNLYYGIATISAFFAVDDPIVISTATTAGSLLSFFDAKLIIVLVTFLNMIQKGFIMYFFGNKKFVKPMILIYLGLLLVTLSGIVYL
ncbi:DUF4010 domain-containing protein [Candidatus Peregrinibacteria bacterium]|nr:DUF4010 domain-containing protein [Candidatus Peregrinibacteria bacterium]